MQTRKFSRELKLELVLFAQCFRSSGNPNIQNVHVPIATSHGVVITQIKGQLRWGDGNVQHVKVVPMRVFLC